MNNTQKVETKNAHFTKFENNTNWCDGKVGKYNFQAKLFDEGSTFEIKNGRVSKLAIWDEEKLDIKPNNEVNLLIY